MKRIKVFIIVLIISYLIGAFYNASFNVDQWSNTSRGITILVGLIFSLALASYPEIDELYE